MPLKVGDLIYKAWIDAGNKPRLAAIEVTKVGPKEIHITRHQAYHWSARLFVRAALIDLTPRAAWERLQADLAEQQENLQQDLSRTTQALLLVEERVHAHRA